MCVVRARARSPKNSPWIEALLWHPHQGSALASCEAIRCLFFTALLHHSSCCQTSRGEHATSDLAWLIVDPRRPAHLSGKQRSATTAQHLTDNQPLQPHHRSSNGGNNSSRALAISTSGTPSKNLRSSRSHPRDRATKKSTCTAAFFSGLDELADLPQEQSRPAKRMVASNRS